MFDKNERSTFKYFFAHWCAYQMTALNLHCWKFKYLFHDIEKPWMLYWYMWVKRLSHTDAYKKVQQWHRHHRSHHLEYTTVYGDNGYVWRKKKPDYKALVIDWECSRFTKINSPRTALQETEYKKQNDDFIWEYDYNAIKNAIAELGLTE